jgi:ribonuclease P protein component
MRHNGAAPTLDSTSSRAGFIVSKAVGGAVVRNRVRRRLRHLMRERLDSLPAGTDVVVRALPSSGSRSFAELGADLDSALATAERGSADRGRRRSR